MMTKTEARTFGPLLRARRQLMMLTLKDVAGQVGTDWQTVQRWENGARRPRPLYQRRLCEVLHLSPEEMQAMLAAPTVPAAPRS